MSELANNIKSKLRFQSVFNKMPLETKIVFAFVILLIIFNTRVFGSSFLSIRNFESSTLQLAEFCFLSLAMGIAMLSGNIDLSIVSTAVLSGIVGGYVLEYAYDNKVQNVYLFIVFAVLAALMVGILCGIFNGFLVGKANINPIVSTLSTKMFFAGVAMIISGGRSINEFPKEYTVISSSNLFIFPYWFVILILLLIVLNLILSEKGRGRVVYFLGSNKTATLFSGYNNLKLTIFVYVCSGILASIAGLVIISRTNSLKVGYGESYLLQAIIVCIMGGLDPYGGRGNLFGVFVAVLLLQIIQNTFALAAFSPYLKNLFWGVMLIAVMALYYFYNKYVVNKNIKKLFQELQFGGKISGGTEKT